MFGGVDKEEYEKVVKANNELRMKMEKLRLQNTLLKDQIRVLSTLQPELARLYVFIQMERSVTLQDIKEQPKFKEKSDAELQEDLAGLMNLRIVDKIEKDGVDRYSIRSPSTMSSPKGMESIRS